MTLKDLLARGTLGRVVEFETHFDRFAPTPPENGVWQLDTSPGTGVVYDLGTHLVDQILALFGLPQKVTGFTSNLTQNKTDDAFTILLHYEDMLATIKATVLSTESKQLRYWVRGDKGSYKKVCLIAKQSSRQNSA